MSIGYERKNTFCANRTFMVYTYDGKTYLKYLKGKGEYIYI